MPSEPASPRQSRASTKWSDLGPRVLSALVLIPLALFCIWHGGGIFAAMTALVAFGMAYEWLGLCKARGDLAAVLPFAALPATVLLAAWGRAGAALLLLALAMLASAILLRGRMLSRLLPLGIPYLGLGAVALVWLRRPEPAGMANVIGLLLVVWASDIGAYVVGRMVGGKLLAPSISPGKTWSGAIGGLVAAAIVGACFSAILGSGAGIWRAIGIAILISIVAQFGDLLESRLKRHFGVKDSGALIPGHGGLLDRLDALLAATPVGALLVLILGRGVTLWE